MVEALFEEEGLQPDPNKIERSAIALNELLDGLWLEGCLAIELFDEDEIAGIGIRTVDAMLDP